ncbi:protein kinase, partial [bacterium]|nr:protein kinase [bacterium]
MVAGKYRVDSVLGRGGFGIVYRALHMDLGKDVALKVLNPDVAHDEAAQKRFLREVETSTSFVHEYAVQLRDFGRDPERKLLYFTMDLIEGETLKSVLKDGPLAEARAVRLAGQLLRVLEKAHGAGIIHRDLKPENLLVTKAAGAEEVRVLDFGIAKAVSTSRNDTSALTLTGTTIGTLYYMSPEQAAGQRLTATADLYSVGVVLYEALSGRRPIEPDPDAENEQQSLFFKLATVPAVELREVAPSVSPAVAAAVMRALEKKPSDRFESARAFRQALARARGAPASEPRVPSAAPEPAASAEAPSARKPQVTRIDVPGRPIDVAEDVARTQPTERPGGTTPAKVSDHPNRRGVLEKTAVQETDKRSVSPDAVKAVVALLARGEKAKSNAPGHDAEPTLAGAQNGSATAKPSQTETTDRRPGVLPLPAWTQRTILVVVVLTGSILAGLVAILGLLSDGSRATSAQSKGDHVGAVGANAVAHVDSLDKNTDQDGDVAKLTAAIELDPKNAQAWANRGAARVSKGDQDGAIADCSRAIEL